MTLSRHVLTGAPGTGKTAVLDLLAHRYPVVPEPARQVIAAHREETEAPGLDHDPLRFVDLLLEMSIENYDEATGPGAVIFDRGVPDCAAYAMVSGVDPEPYLRQARSFEYEAGVFLFPPWREIYTTDDMRRATFEQIVVFHGAVVDVYESLGYRLVEMPLASVEERARFIVDRVTVM